MEKCLAKVERWFCVFVHLGQVKDSGADAAHLEVKRSLLGKFVTSNFV